MTQVAISIQTLGNKKDTYLRKEVGTMHRGTILAAVEDMLTHPDAHNLSRVKAKSPWAKRRQPALKPDDEVLPGVEVSAAVDRALDEAT